MNRTQRLVIAPLALVMALAASANARPFGPFGGPGGRGPGHEGGGLGLGDGQNGGGTGPVPNPCRQDCRSTSSTCTQQARSDAQQCVQTNNCTTLVQTAKDACAANPMSTDCQAARGAARTCVQPCTQALVTALTACKSDKRVCAETCPSPTPGAGVPGLQCVSDCRSTARTCQSTATGTAQTCLTGCNDVLTAAKQACGANYMSSDCKTARQQAVACIDPCTQALVTAVMDCNQTGRTCAAACVPTPTPTPVP